MMFTELLLNKEMDDAGIRMTLSFNLVFMYRFQDHNLAFCCCVLFVKYEFSAEIWFVKTLTRIMKYKPGVIKLNLV